MFTFISNFRENRILHFDIYSASILPNAFLVELSAFLVGPYAFFPPYHFDANSPQTGPCFSYHFPKKLRTGRTGHMISYSDWTERKTIQGVIVCVNSKSITNFEIRNVL